MRNLFLSGFIFMLMVSGCGYNGTPTRGPSGIVPLTSIEIIPVSSVIAKGTTTTLSANGFFAGVPGGDITNQVVWSSSDTAVANFITASNKNRVSGIAAGTAVITATVGSVTATYTLTVSSATVTTLTISTVPPSTTTPTVHAGLTKQFVATGTFLDGTTQTTQDLTFDATWSADASGFASVSNDPASKGLAKGLLAGTATLTASFGAVPATTSLVVTAPLLQSITVTPANDTVAGLTITKSYTATGTYSDGTTAPIPSTTPVTWASSQPTIATIVATSGVATTVAPGTTSISATLTNADGASISGKTNLTVTSLVLTLTPSSQILSVNGGTIKFTLTSTPAGGTAQDVTASSSWISSNVNVATVDTTSNRGFVTAVAVGTTTITATYNSQQISATVTVQ